MKQCPIDFFDPEVQHLAASAGCRLYRMQNDTGEGLISEYPIPDRIGYSEMSPSPVSFCIR